MALGDQRAVHVHAGANGQVTGPGDGWHALGGSVTVTAVPNAYWHFAGWSGDVSGADTNDNPLTLTLDRASDITAAFDENRTTNTDTPEWWLALYGLTNARSRSRPSATPTATDCAHGGAHGRHRPTNRSSAFEIVKIGVLREGAERFITFASSTTRVYTLQASACPLALGAWTNLNVRNPGTNSLTTFSDTGEVSSCFYRIQVGFR